MLGKKLIDMGLVDLDQLLTALAAQESRAPSLHALAVEIGALSRDEALEFLDLRASGDERSFEIVAQENLWLTKRDIETLYQRRASRRPRLGEVLVRLGFLAPVDLERALESLRSASAA